MSIYKDITVIQKIYRRTSLAQEETRRKRQECHDERMEEKKFFFFFSASEQNRFLPSFALLLALSSPQLGATLNIEIFTRKRIKKGKGKR